MHGAETRAVIRARVLHQALKASIAEEELLLQDMAKLLEVVRGRRALARLGHARFDAYMAERLGHTARWAEQLLVVNRMIERFGAIREALKRGFLCRTKILVLSRIVTDATVGEWVLWAAAHTVRELENAARKATPGSSPPSDPEQPRWLWDEEKLEGGAAGAAGAAAAGAFSQSAQQGAWLQVRTPSSVAHLFDHSLEVVARVVGEELLPFARWDLVLAEVASEIARPGSRTAEELARRVAEEPLPFAPPTAGRAREPERNGNPRTSAGASPGAAPPSDPFLADQELRRLARARQRRHLAIARLLALLRNGGHLRALGYASLEVYCREALGISPRWARELVWAEGRFAELPRVARAYREGRLSWAKAHLVLTVATRTTESAWIGRAAAVTVRYLAREVAVARRQKEESPEGGAPLPLHTMPPGAADSPIRPGVGLHRNEDTSSASDQQAPVNEDTAGTRRTFSHEESDRSSPCPCVVRLWVPVETARLHAAIAADLSAEVAGGLEPWEALFLILRHFLLTWDRPERQGHAIQRAILERDGYQCAAPGCTARRGLEVHHIVFRSHGGVDRPENLVTLCSLHHRLALHDEGGLHCTGTAHADLHWILGRARFHGDVREAAARA